MSKKPMADIYVKWPGLLVKGEPVTPDQAAEILIRTSQWPLVGNARRARRRLNEMAGFKSWLDYDTADRNWGAIETHNEAAYQRLGVLRSLDYLCNQRLLSAWIGGPHGWVDWQGRVFAAQYNIGKWPNIGEVTEEWRVIAKAFPYLRLTCQVLNCEIGYPPESEPVRPTHQWIVKDGKVRVTDNPRSFIIQPIDFEPTARSWGDPEGCEVGATDEQVRCGLELAARREELLT